MTHQVEEYHFKDGSIYIAPRSDDRTVEEIIYHGKTHPGTSPVYQAIRNNLFDSKRVIFRNISKAEAETKAKTLMEYYRSLNRKVLNVKN